MNWINFLPELGMLTSVAVFLVLACLSPAAARRDHVAAVTLGGVTAILCVTCISQNGSLFNGVYQVDLFSQVFKSMLAVGFFLVAYLCRELAGISSRRHTECYLLLSISTLAMMLLVSSMHLLAIYMALELSSYSLYILVFMRREERWGLNAGLKYFLMGISASAIMLFGLALIYGSTGVMHLNDLVQLAPELMKGPVVAGVLMTLGGFFFKLAIFPFHFWAPDAYEGAPNQVAAFISTASKVAAIAVLIRVVAAAEVMEPLLSNGLIALAIISMTIGNIGAIAQTDFKRLMAFSSIAQAGYLLIGILCMSPGGYGGTVFYVVAVLIMKFTCFMVMVAVAEDGRNLKVSELAGLHRRSPVLALALMMALFGLAGIPPTVGFAGKLLIFKAAIEKGYLMLVIIAMINVVISLYYYLMVLKAAYLDKEDQEQPDLVLSYPGRVLAVLMVVAIVAVGFYPTLLMELVNAATQL